MFAHKVIEMYQAEKILPLAYNIKNSIKYHFEDIESIKSLTLKSDELFTGEYGKALRLPFKVCWFDYVKDNGQKVGALVTEHKQNTLLVQLYFINKKNVKAFPHLILIGLTNEPFNFVENINNLFNENINIKKISNNVFITASVPINEEECLPEIKNINACMLLLSCKNIESENKLPPKKLNKKRRKKNKVELQEYKTLKLVLPKQQNRKTQGTKDQKLPVRLHLCAGHFKTYTKDAPLFGRYVGRFWWQAHIKGNDSVGQVAKDYQVKPNDTK